MKTALIHRKDHVFPDYEAYLIENPADLDEYGRYVMDVAERAFKKVLHSTIPLEKFDHIIPFQPSVEKGLMTMALVRSKTNDVGIQRGRSLLNNPIHQIIPSATEKIEAMRLCIQRGETLIVNENGGFMPHNDSDIDILNVYDQEIMEKTERKSVIQDDTQWLVLENDLVLPKESAEFLKRTDPKFSAIYDLRGYGPEQFRKLLETFKQKGGHTVFVYTTGLDVQQMYEYTDALAKAGLKKLLFYFNSGVDSSISEYLQYAKKKMDVTVVANLENFDLPQ
jgi:hypothetical protein